MSPLGSFDRARAYAGTPPEALEAAARERLAGTLGPSSQPVASAFAPAALNLISDHTHYSNGFALLIPVVQGTAVALRRTEHRTGRVVIEEESTVYPLDDGQDVPAWVQVVAATMAAMDGGGEAVDVALGSTVPSSTFDAFLAALALATARAVMAHQEAHKAPGRRNKQLVARLPALRQQIAACTGLPFSIAPLIGSARAQPGDPFTLVDTATREQLPVETAARDALAWRLIDPQVAPRDVAFHRRRRDQADEAIDLLQRRAFPELRSFRELEHQDIPRAMEALPARLTSVARHLVTDNRRVQKMVAALRRSDWQMVGALLLMSHASRRDAWQGTSAEADFLVEHVEATTLEGIYGACMTGRGGAVVVVGQPRAFPRGLDRLTAAFDERFGRPPRTMPL
jgi:galactokinase